MAEYRQTYCRIWTDNWFIELKEDEKLLYVYYFTNEHTSVAGIYEISLKVMAFETGLKMERVMEILQMFIDEKKCRYENGILWMFNMPKYQGISGPRISQKILTRIQKDVARLADTQIRRDFITLHGKVYGIDILSIGYPQNDSDTDTDTEKDKETEMETETEKAAAKSPKSNIFTLYENNIGMINPMMAEKLKLAEDEYPPGWIKRAIEIAVENNKRSWNYIQAILDRWRSNGYDGDRKNGKSHQAEQAKSVVAKIAKEATHGRTDNSGS